jgi:cell division protein FtsQ
MRLLTFLAREDGEKRRRGRSRTTQRAIKAAISASAALAVIGAGTWAWRSGTVGAAIDATGAAVARAGAGLGLSVNEITLEGRRHAGREDILAALGAGRGTPLLGFDPHAAKTRLEALPWIRAAAVERQAPGLIHVRIEERQPFALWQMDRTLMLIDRDGVVLTDSELERFGDLLMLVGADAPRHAHELFDIIGTEPSLARRVTAAVRVGGRRWNLRLDDAIEIKLPEDAPVQAWSRLAELERANGLLARDIASIDLRLPDRLLVTTTSGELPTKPRTEKRGGKNHET